MKIDYSCIEGVSYEPKQHSADALGYDLCATELERIDRFDIKTIKTGIVLDPPFNVGFILCIRSGLAKQGLMLMNGVGIIDPDYRGEVMMMVTNISKNPIVIKPGDRVGQLIPYKAIDDNEITFEYTEMVSTTKRNTGGFGSTG